jgi:hypothetical protein
VLAGVMNGDFASGLCMGHDGGGLAAASGAGGVGRGAFAGTSLQNQPMVARLDVYSRRLVGWLQSQNVEGDSGVDRASVWKVSLH